MKKLVKFVPLVIILVTLGGCYASCGPIHIGSPSYTLTWNPEVSGFPNVNLTLTPIIPPKALSWKPSDYVLVDLTVGNFSFSTDDPAYQCLETVATTVLPIIFAPQSEVISGFNAINDFLIAYHACGQFVQTSHANLASLGGIAENNLIFFQITGQKMVSQAANGQGLTPFGSVGGNTPTPIPTFTPTPTLNATATAMAMVSQYDGTWVNDNPKTQDIPKLIISNVGQTLYVHGYGACTPTYCDWGTVGVQFNGEPIVVTFVFDGNRPDACCTGAPTVQLTITSGTSNNPTITELMVVSVDSASGTITNSMHRG